MQGMVSNETEVSNYPHRLLSKSRSIITVVCVCVCLGLGGALGEEGSVCLPAYLFVFLSASMCSRCSSEFPLLCV